MRETPPALTPSEWDIALHKVLADDGGIEVIDRDEYRLWHHDQEVGVRDKSTGMPVSVAGEACHPLAALALYGQPFGFTQRDANNCRAIAESWPIARPEEMQRAMASLAARIAALLPPEEP